MKQLIILLISLVSLNAYSQNIDNEIKASFNVFLDNQKIETDSVMIGFVSNNSIHTITTISDTFTTFFKSDKVYHIVITHPHYNKQTLRIITDKKQGIVDINVYLSSKSPDCSIGYYKYNKFLNKYIKYE